MLSPSSWGSLGELPHEFGIGLGAMVALFVFEWFNQRREYGFAWYPPVVALRWLVYLLLVAAIIFGAPVTHDSSTFSFEE